MANIKSYDAPQGLGLQPTETGIEANVQSARRIGAFADQAGNALAQTGERAAGAIKDAGQVAVQYVDNKDRSNVWTAATGLLANLDAKWNTATKGNGLDPSDPNYVAPADPRDPTIAQKFMDEQVQPALDKLRQIPMGEAGNQYAESQIEQIRQHLSQKVTADLSTMAGEAAVVNDRQTTNNLSNYVTTSPDFHSVDMALQMHKDASATASSNPNISGPQLGQLKEHFQQSQEQIVHAAASAAISKAADPQAVAASFIERYPDYIKGDEAKTLAGNARQQIRANNYDVEINRRRDKEIATDKSNAAQDQYLIDVRSQDPKLANDPTAKKILNDPALLSSAKNNLLNLMDRQLKPETEARLSQSTFVNLLRDLRNPDADTDKVMQKAWDARLTDPGKPGSMSEKDFNQFRTEVQARKTPEGAALETDRAAFFKNYGTSIAGAAYTPQLGDPKVYNAEMDARRVEADLKHRGLDPHLAYDPASPYFLGKPERLQKWQGNMQRDLQTRATLPGNGLPPAKDITGVQVVPAPAATSAPRPAAPKLPEKGFIKDGYEFLGGNPGEAASWRKVGERT